MCFLVLMCLLSYLKHIKRSSFIWLPNREHVNQIGVGCVHHKHPALDLRDRKWCREVDLKRLVYIIFRSNYYALLHICVLCKRVLYIEGEDESSKDKRFVLWAMLFHRAWKICKPGAWSTWENKHSKAVKCLKWSARLGVWKREAVGKTHVELCNWEKALLERFSVYLVGAID